ncbi:MAG: polysaccharide deacetylase family protein [Flavobacteriales bacterium]|nr:polysaccharide deacetylase family protein [Flavobacteriales bacterium]
MTRTFRVVSTEEAFALRAAGSPPDRHTISISFDDGYSNNLDVALPIIEKYKVPVTFFILGPCAELHGDRVSWTDLIAALLRRGRGLRIDVLGGTYVDMVEVSSRRNLVDDLKRALPSDRDEALRHLDATFGLREYLNGIDRSVWELMGPDQLLSLASSSYVEIGSHAYAHYNLGLIPLDDAINDMARSKQALEHLVGKPIESIAYPDGSYSDTVKDAAERLGFKRQLAVDYRCAGDPADRRIQARHGVPATTTTASAMLFLNGAFDRRGIL